MVHATYHQTPPGLQNDRLQWHSMDITAEADIEEVCALLGEVDFCINAAGMLHDQHFKPEKSTRQIDPDYFLHSMATNALPTLMLAKHLASHFRHKRPAHFATISARVGSIEENRLGGWYSYRASKAALNMALKTLSIEWKRSLPNVTVSALHPGTTDTELSKPYQSGVPRGNLFSAAQSVGYMTKVLEGLDPRQTGNFWSFDGERLPW